MLHGTGGREPTHAQLTERLSRSSSGRQPNRSSSPSRTRARRRPWTAGRRNACRVLTYLRSANGQFSWVRRCALPFKALRGLASNQATRPNPRSSRRRRMSGSPAWDRLERAPLAPRGAVAAGFGNRGTASRRSRAIPFRSCPRVSTGRGARQGGLTARARRDRFGSVRRNAFAGVDQGRGPSPLARADNRPGGRTREAGPSRTAWRPQHATTEAIMRTAGHASPYCGIGTGQPQSQAIPGGLPAVVTEGGTAKFAPELPNVTVVKSSERTFAAVTPSIKTLSNVTCVV